MNRPNTNLWIHPAGGEARLPLPGDCLLQEERNGVTLMNV